jgi:hypothetical protein
MEEVKKEEEEEENGTGKREEMRRQQGKGQMGGNVGGNGHRMEGPIRRKKKRKKVPSAFLSPTGASLLRDMMSPSSQDFFPHMLFLPPFPRYFSSPLATNGGGGPSIRPVSPNRNSSGCPRTDTLHLSEVSEERRGGHPGQYTANI